MTTGITIKQKGKRLNVESEKMNETYNMTQYERLIDKWQLASFGVKQRVKNDIGASQMQYVLNTPDYSNLDKIHEIIVSINTHSAKVALEAIEMDLKIKSI